MKARILLLAMVAVATLPAATITTVYNTGEQNLTHTLLALGSTDPHWFTGANGSGTALKVSNGPNVAWLPNTALGTHSEWVDNTSQRVLPGDESIYTQFDLTGFDLASVSLSFRIAADNDIISYGINGGPSIATLLPTGVSSNFTQFHSFALTSSTPGVSFNAGINYLRFDVMNEGQDGGFRAEFTGATANAVPEPGTLALAGAALLGLGAMSRLRHSRRRMMLDIRTV